MIIILPANLNDAIRATEADTIVHPSWLSPLTSMQVRYAIDSRCDDEITAFRIKDAMAAISARSIAKRKPKVTMRIMPNSKPPKGIPADVKAGVDRWIFPTGRLRDLYPSDLNGATVETIVDTAFDGKPSHSPQAAYYAWIGGIDGNTERLKKAIEWIDSQAGDCTLAVFGIGKARNVMPAVKLARSIFHPDRISWMGQPMTASHCDVPFTAVIQAGLDPTPLENRFAAEGIPLIQDINS